MKILYAPDTSDHQNWGCQVMGQAFRYGLVEAGASALARIPSAWFFQRNGNHGVLTDRSDLVELRHCADAVAAGRALPELAQALQACDLVFCNAENFLRPGTLKGRRLLLLLDLASRVYAKPVVLANATLDLDEPALADMVHAILPGLDEVQVREAHSQALLADRIGPDRLRQVPDVAWTQPAAPAAQWLALGRRRGSYSAWPDTADGFDPARPYVTLSASSLHALPAHRDRNPLPDYLALARALRERFGQVLLVASDQPDLGIFRAVQRELGLPLLGTHLPVRQAIDVLGHARVHLGGRWHPGIFASSGGTPLVAFSANNGKMHSLQAQLQADAPVFDASRLGEQIDAIVAAAERQRASGEPLRARLRARAAELARQAAGALDSVRRRARGI